jgi:hypothetical protein
MGLHNDSRIVDPHARQTLRKWLLRQILTGFRKNNYEYLLANFKYFIGRFVKNQFLI